MSREAVLPDSARAKNRRKYFPLLAAAMFLLSSIAAEMYFIGRAAETDPGVTSAQFTHVRRSYLEESGGALKLDRPGYKFESRLTIHPFFGYVYNPGTDGINSFGFKSRYDFSLCGGRYCLKDASLKNPLVIGIFGGSFADTTASQGAYLEEKLRDLFPDRTPVVLNFGVGGHAMPQAYFIFSYFSEMLDAAVFLDGLNELWNADQNNKSGSPPEFAKARHFKYKLSLTELTPENFRLTGSILKTKQFMLGLTRLSLAPGLEQSFFVHYLWQTVHARVEEAVQKKMSAIAESYSSGSPFFEVPDEAVLELAAAKWETYHRRIHRIGIEENILTVHLLQPSPFVEGSKELTDYEKKQVRNSYPVRSYVADGYPKLLSRLSALSQSGAVAEDLLYIYKDVEESIWYDSAHANHKGLHLVLDRIAEILNSHRAALN